MDSVEPVRFSYDPEAKAFYFYFTHIVPGSVGETFPDVLCDVKLTAANQIAGFTVLDEDEDGERYSWAGRLKYVGDDAYEGGLLTVYYPSRGRLRTLRWYCNVNVDREDQILGVEFLFAEKVLPPPS